MFTLAEKALIIALLDMWHTTNRPTWFYGTTTDLAGLMGSSEQTFKTARRGLVEKRIIKYQRGHQHNASQYHISQDFLHSLTKDQLPTLKTSTYSDGIDSSGLESIGDHQTARF